MAIVNSELARHLCAAVNRIRDLQDAITDLQILGVNVTVHFCGSDYKEDAALETLKQAGYDTDTFEATLCANEEEQ